MFGSKDLLFSSEKYGVAKSLRFRSGSTTYFNRTQGTPTNNKKWTWSGWVKRGSLANGQFTLFSAGSGNDRDQFQFGDEGGGFNDFQFYIRNSTGALGRYTTAAVYRDPSAWYHVVLVYDSANTTAANRVLLYVNGGSVTLTANTTLGIDTNSFTNQSGIVGYIGSQITTAGQYFDGYMAEVNFIDGQALEPTYFGAYDTNGIWQPKAYSGSGYGNNGFYLKFTDVGATSGSNTGYGKDFAGTNYWTTNNFGTTSNLTTYDSMLDSPTNAAGDIGNYCVLNPLDSAATISNGNLTQTKASADGNSRSTFQIPSSGLWYVEATATSTTNASTISCGFGLATASASLTANSYNLANAWNLYSSSLAYINRNGTPSSSLGFTLTAGDVVQIAVDPANNRAWIGRNDTWYDSGTGTTGNPSSGTNPTVSSLPSGLFIFANTFNQTFDVNFGQRPFVKTVPTSYSALNTQNLTTPTITNGAQYMAAVTYTGNSSTQTITTSSTNSGNNPNGTSFQPDFVWIKNRSITSQHVLTDVVRGVDKQLFSSLTNAEQTSATGITSFNSNGFSLGSNVSPTGDTNSSPNSFIAWEWKAGNSSGSSNTSGSITSTVSVNTTAGFSVVTYTGTGANATVGHGLGVAPSMIIVKNRNSTFTWRVYHASLANTQVLYLSATDAATTETTAWNSTTPASTVFSIGTSSGTNGNTNTYVAYCFAPVAGYSAFGSYTGNSSTDGTFVYTGFRPRYVLYKNITTAATGWIVFDTSRDAYNITGQYLQPNTSGAEGTSGTMDILSNGFKLRASSTDTNASGNTYIYAAFAENPFKISRAR